ncbi:hypothetical protein MTO96_021245 [Rhipicephalus appendiculatus]
MLPAPELSIHRATDPVSTALTKGCVQGFSRSDFHQPAASCELLIARMPKGREWLLYAVTDVQSRFAEQEQSSIHGVEAAQVRNDDALQVVLVDLVLCQYIVLAQYIGLNNQWLQGGCIDFHHYRVTSRRGLYTVLHALEVAPSLSEEIFDLTLTTDATGCSRLREMLKLRGNQCGVLAVGIQHLGGLGKLSHGPSR